jgi:malonyl-CoA O-methyltransferase
MDGGGVSGPRDYALDRARVKRSFGRAASRYDEFAVLQTRVREKLLGRLDDVRLEPALVADVGCGTGHAADVLARRYPRARVLAVDLAEGMLQEARRRHWFRRPVAHACADLHRLPLRDASADLLFCNLALQWCDLDAALAELRRVLKPRGLLTFTTFGPDTLMELRAAWAAADDRVHVHAFLDVHDVGDALVRAGLAEPVLDVERYTLTYPDAHGVMRDLKSLGAGNASTGRARGLTSPRRLAAVEAAYEATRRDGRLPATYEVIYAHAWGALPRAAQAGEPGEARVPVEHVGRRSR